MKFKVITNPITLDTIISVGNALMTLREAIMTEAATAMGFVNGRSETIWSLNNQAQGIYN